MGVRGVTKLNSIQLSNRLKKVCSYVKEDAVIADIGSDHAYLPCYLVLNNKVNKAIAGEVVRGPYESALRNVKKNGLQEHVSVRLANGLFAIEPSDDVDTVIIAGMGGTLISTILDKGIALLGNVSRLILQPNLHAQAIRQWAVENKWKIVAEDILNEDDKIYEIVVLEKGSEVYNELELLVGPFLISSKNDAFIEKWTRETNEWRRVLKSLENAEETMAIKSKKEQLITNLALIGKVLST